MDARRFDTLVRSLSERGSRRGLLGELAAVPFVSGLVAVLDAGEGAAMRGEICDDDPGCVDTRDCKVCKADGACAPNTPPVAFNGSFFGDEGIPCLQVSLIGSDEDRQALTFEVTSLPANGELFEFNGGTTATSETLCYQPFMRFFHGTDAFTYMADDGINLSEEATIDIVINDIN